MHGLFLAIQEGEGGGLVGSGAVGVGTGLTGDGVVGTTADKQTRLLKRPPLQLFDWQSMRTLQDSPSQQLGEQECPLTHSPTGAGDGKVMGALVGGMKSGHESLVGS